MNHDENFCAEIQSTLPLYVGGDLEAQALAEVRAHLFDCPRCAERALSARAARRELVGALRLASRPGPDLWAGVRAALAEEGILQPDVPIAASSAPLSSARPWWRSGHIGIAAAVAAVLGIAIGANWRSGDGVVRDGGSAPIVSQPDALQKPLVPEVQFVNQPTVDPSSSLAQGPVAQVPAVPEGGLRRLQPGERQLRETVPPIPIDRVFMYGAPPGSGFSGRPADSMQPVSLHRVGANAPRW